MTSTELKVALVLPDNRVAEVVSVPPFVLRRMARHQQWQSARSGLAGPVEACLALVPRRGATHSAAALRWELSAGDRSVEHTVPTSALQPLMAEPAAAVRRSAALPAEATLRYAVLLPEDPLAVWQERLDPFASLAMAHRRSAWPLFPDLAVPEDAPVLVGQDVLSQAVAYCLDREVEKGGVLLGYLCRLAGGSALWAEVVAFAPAIGAAADSTHLTFTADAWQSIERQRVAIERSLGLHVPLQTLGWIHGHPRLAELGPFFLSHHDVSIMSQHFAEPFAIAVVVDAWAETTAPVAEAVAVFGWDEHGAGLVPRSLDILSDAAEPRRVR